MLFVCDQMQEVEVIAKLKSTTVCTIISQDSATVLLRYFNNIQPFLILQTKINFPWPVYGGYCSKWIR